MACLQNGTTLLNNNNLSSFKHNIMKYDETHANVYTSQINNFLSNQIPFRNNHTKDKTQSDNNVFNDEEKEKEQETEKVNNEMKHSCANDRNAPSDDEDDECRTRNDNKNNDNNNANENNNEILNEKSEINTTNTSAYNYNDESYKKEFPSDKGATVAEPTESGEPSHHARRPMNAFLIFCKRHRTIVKNRYPHLENRAVTKILGEWWAGLEPDDKASYTELAKQYKNAFFSANPNFKWYKLPAPPLRTLNTRPGNIVKSPPPPKDPHDIEEQLPSTTSQPLPQPQQPQQLFTPGKLADETQLGSITSLINASGGGATKTTILNNNNTNSKNNENDEQLNYKNYLLSPENSNMINSMCQPPKPFKKRLLLSPSTTTEAKNVVVRNIFTENTGTNTTSKTEGNIFDSSLLQEALQSFVYDEAFEGDFHLDSNLTQQELINKVVDHMCSSTSSSKTDSNDGHPEGDDDDLMDDEYNQDDASRETRKSVRACKGLLYAKFMAEGKLFVSKRNRKALAATKSSFVSSNVSDKVPRNTEPIELSDTIKKLAERTIGSGIGSSSGKTTATNTTTPSNSITNNYMKIMDHEQQQQLQQQQQQQIEQEQHEETMKKMFRAADFNLDEKIEALPSLSLDKFQQKKKENKKRKFLRATKMKETERKKISTSAANTNTSASASTSENETTRSEMNLIGSRKRKPIGKPRKQNNNNNNTNINNNNKDSSCEIDLFGLATLAEVAAKKAKIDQK